MTAHAAAVRAGAAEIGRTAERAVHDEHGAPLVLAQDAQRRAAEIGPHGVAHVVEEARVHDLETAAPHEDGASAPAFFELVGRVAVDEREVLHRQPT